MNLYKFCFVFFFSLIAFYSKSQDTLIVSGKVLSIDSIRYYMVLKVKACETCASVVILSNRTTTLNSERLKCKEIFVNNYYCFTLKKITTFKGEDGINIFLNLRKFNYYNVFSLDNGEVPYISLTMENKVICPPF